MDTPPPKTPAQIARDLAAKQQVTYAFNLFAGCGRKFAAATTHDEMREVFRGVFRENYEGKVPDEFKRKGKPFTQDEVTAEITRRTELACNIFTDQHIARMTQEMLLATEPQKKPLQAMDLLYRIISEIYTPDHPLCQPRRGR